MPEKIILSYCLYFIGLAIFVTINETHYLNLIINILGNLTAASLIILGIELRLKEFHKEVYANKNNK